MDMSFGTGAVKITPAHDPNDFKTGQRHKLDSVNIFDDGGLVNEAGGPFAGQPRFTARRTVVEFLQARTWMPTHVLACRRKHAVRPAISQLPSGATSAVHLWKCTVSQLRALSAVASCHVVSTERSPSKLSGGCSACFWRMHAVRDQIAAKVACAVCAGEGTIPRQRGGSSMQRQVLFFYIKV